MIHVLDLHFQEHPGTIAAFLVETDVGPVLVESGPATTLRALENGLAAHGYALTDIQHVFLSHIHFDHAGAAWRFAEHGATIHVHPFGVDHLADPEVLWKSAKRVFEDAMETLWGEMRPIPSAQLHACADGESVAVGDTSFIAHHTPGHAKHHIAWQLDRVLFTGDVGGVALRGGPAQPPCPPPDIHLDDWDASLDKIVALKPEVLYLTHYGEIRAIASHVETLRRTLGEWCRWVESHLPGTTPQALVPAFEEEVRAQLQNAGLGEDAIADYEVANPAFMSVAGLARYLTKVKLV